VNAIDCPCGSGTRYDACCGPLHRGVGQAETAEQLMRSRYSAYALNEVDYVLRTWHPRTQPGLDKLDHRPGDAVTWTGLTIHDSGPDWVDFTARFQGPGGEGTMHERSRFEHRRGRWVYVDGDVT